MDKGVQQNMAKNHTLRMCSPFPQAIRFCKTIKAVSKASIFTSKATKTASKLGKAARLSKATKAAKLRTIPNQGSKED